MVTVEIDTGLAPVARQVIGQRPNVRFVFGDALASKNELNPDMLAAWDEASDRPLRAASWSRTCPM